MSAAQRTSFAVPIGCMLAALGLLLTGTLLEAAVFPVGALDWADNTRRAVALGAVRLGLVAAGLYVLAKRPRITVIHLSAVAIASAGAGLFAALVLQFVYVAPTVLSGWRSSAPAAELNQLGFRGVPIAYSPGDYVVVLVGDSQVEALAMALEDIPERRLEAHLRSRGRAVKVFSIGASGYGQDQELLALQEFFGSHRADLVVIWQTPENDIWNNLFKTHMFNLNPKPTFWLDREGTLRGPSEALGQRLGDSPIAAVQLVQLALGVPWRDKSWERSLPKPYVPLEHYEGPVRTEWQRRWDKNVGFMRDENLATEKSHLAVSLTPRSERMQYGLDLTRALTRRILELVEDHQGALVLFQTERHDYYTVDDEVFVLNGKFYRVSGRQVQANWDYVNRGFDTEVIPVTVEDWRVGPQDPHLNAQATDQVMADLAERLLTRIGDARPDEVAAPEARLRRGR